MRKVFAPHPSFCWLGHVLRRSDDHLTRVIYQFGPPSSNYPQPCGRPRQDVVHQDVQQIQSGIRGCFNVLPKRPSEVEGQDGSLGLNVLVAQNLTATVKIYVY